MRLTVADIRSSKHKNYIYMKNLNNTNKTSENTEKELRISDVISSLTLEDITKIVNAFTDINIPIEAVREEIELNYL